MSSRHRIAIGLWVLLTLAAIAPIAFGQERAPTVQEYVRLLGGHAQIVPAGHMTIDGHKVICGTRPTVLDDKLNDYGAAFPGFLIINPTLLEKVSTPVKLWIYAHECGHQFRGSDEEQADCFAVERGRRLGWLTAQGLEEVCRFIANAKINRAHYAGARRCRSMRECYSGLSNR